MNEHLPDAVADLQPAAAHIYRELEFASDGCLTVSELKNRTGRDQSTIRRATTDLEHAGFVENEWSDEDPRQRLICLRR